VVGQEGEVDVARDPGGEWLRGERPQRREARENESRERESLQEQLSRIVRARAGPNHLVASSPSNSRERSARVFFKIKVVRQRRRRLGRAMSCGSCRLSSM